MNNCNGTQVRDLPIKLKDDVLCVCNGYRESRLGLGGELVGVARQKYIEVRTVAGGELANHYGIHLPTTTK